MALGSVGSGTQARAGAPTVEESSKEEQMLVGVSMERPGLVWFSMEEFQWVVFSMEGSE